MFSVLSSALLTTDSGDIELNGIIPLISLNSISRDPDGRGLRFSCPVAFGHAKSGKVDSGDRSTVRTYH